MADRPGWPQIDKIEVSGKIANHWLTLFILRGLRSPYVTTKLKQNDSQENIKLVCWLPGEHMESIDIFLPDSKSTRDFGFKLGRILAKNLADNYLALPFLITLSGELGAGKTTVSQGLGEALGVAEPGEIVSPTFTLANEYRGCWDIFHLDIYRLETEDQFFEAGLDEYLHRNGICLLEWPEKMPDDFWPGGHLPLTLTFKDKGRLLSLPAFSWLAELGNN